MSAKKINVILHTPSDVEPSMVKIDEFILDNVEKRIRKLKVGDQIYVMLGKENTLHVT